MTYERITAEQIEPGDRVARSRNDQFTLIARVEHHDTAVSLYAVDPNAGTYGTPRSGKFARPRKTAKWWRRHA